MPHSHSRMTNQNNNNEGMDCEDLTNEQLAELNSIVVLSEPAEFMPYLVGMNRENALAVLELTHRGKLSPSYQIYGFLLMLSLMGDIRAVVNQYKNGIDYLKQKGIFPDNDNTNN